MLINNSIYSRPQMHLERIEIHIRLAAESRLVVVLDAGHITDCKRGNLFGRKRAKADRSVHTINAHS